MKKLSPLTRRHSPGRRLGMALAVVSLCLSACGKGGEEEEIAAGPIEACVVSRKDGKRLIGTYLREVKAAPGFSMFSVTGKTRRTGLPRNLAFDDRKIRRIREDDTGPLTGSRQSTAIPRKGFGNTGSLPAVYDLTYRTGKVDYKGPMVVGISAAGSEIPTTGQIAYSGKVQLTLDRFGDNGSVTQVASEGRFSANIGFGSGRAAMTISGLRATSGGGVPFAELSWKNLGLCGTRVVSSGQGSVRVKSPDGRRMISPFAAGRSPTPMRSSFEAAQFATADRPGPPDKFGGAFVVESDAGTLAAVFLSD